MATPELIVATSAVTSYPGGVKAVRAKDWMTAGRTSGTDSLASSGTYALETQKVNSSGDNYHLDQSIAYSLATDTLVLPVADLGLAPTFDYDVYVVYRIDGDWDKTKSNTLTRSDHTGLVDICAFGLHGDSLSTEEFPYITSNLLGHIPHYAITALFVEFVNNSQTIHIRAYSQQGSTNEIRIDQLIFIPYLFYGRFVAGDFIGGAYGASVDGADGGDTWGKFTRFQRSGQLDHYDFLNSNADFQRKSSSGSAEYNLQIAPNDNFNFFGVTNPISTHAYSLHNVRYQSFTTEDTFDNRSTTVNGLDMGLSVDGYGYRIGFPGVANLPGAYVEGGVGKLRLNQSNSTIEIEWGSESRSIPPSANNNGAELRMADAFNWSGVLQHTAGLLPGGTGPWRFYLGHHGILGLPYIIYFNTLLKTWQLVANFGPAGAIDFPLGSLHDISSWYSAGAMIGFRFEKRRYKLRVRFWDASGAEPSTWDDEVFVPVAGPIINTKIDYPYANDFTNAQLAYFGFAEFGIHIFGNASGGLTLPYIVTIHSLKMEHDPGGSPADMTAYLESPPGTFDSEIVIPYGAPHFVYWGHKVWTQPHTITGEQCVTFATKVFNDPGAAELQRAEDVQWRFLAQPLTLIPIHWHHGHPANKIILRP